MHLLVGLGNPGSEYAQQRHNIGFRVIDAISGTYRFSLPKQKYKGELYDGVIGEEKVMLLKPRTYMNLSGESVGEAARFHKLPLAQIIVIHDDLDLAPGKVRVKQGGGHGGHNGLKSIDAHLGQDYWRVRIGIGHPGDRERVTGHVLGNFTPEEAPAVEALIRAVAEAIPRLLKGRKDAFMTRVAELQRL